MTVLRMTAEQVQAYQKRAANGFKEPYRRGKDKGGPFKFEPPTIEDGVYSVRLPMKLVSIANAGEHFHERKRRVKAEHDIVNQAIKRRDLPPLPVKVTITRIGPRALDDDNATISAKGVRDAIARLYEWDDGSPKYQWIVKQQKGEYGVLIEIEPL